MKRYGDIMTFPLLISMFSGLNLKEHMFALFLYENPNSAQSDAKCQNWFYCDISSCWRDVGLKISADIHSIAVHLCSIFYMRHTLGGAVQIFSKLRSKLGCYFVYV